MTHPLEGSYALGGEDVLHIEVSNSLPARISVIHEKRSLRSIEDEVEKSRGGSVREGVIVLMQELLGQAGGGDDQRAPSAKANAEDGSVFLCHLVQRAVRHSAKQVQMPHYGQAARSCWGQGKPAAGYAASPTAT